MHILHSARINPRLNFVHLFRAISSALRYARRVDLTQRQRDLLQEWLPNAEVVTDHSWGLVGTVVLELRLRGERYIAKAGDAADHHLAREIRAHRNWLTPWTSRGRAPEFVCADDDAKLLLTRFLPGELVEGTPAEWAPATYDEAGELLSV